MSEMTLITKRYDDIVDFTSKVNKSIIVFKKKSLIAESVNEVKYPNLEVSEAELTTAKENLLQSLIDLEKFASETEYNNKLLGLSENSALQKFVVGKDNETKDVDVIVDMLKEDKLLSTPNFLTLDKIISILDSERNLLFRKLRTARG